MAVILNEVKSRNFHSLHHAVGKFGLFEETADYSYFFQYNLYSKFIYEYNIRNSELFGIEHPQVVG